MQPRGSRIRFNTCRELGIWEKQSSFYTTFKSGRNTVEGNLVWNGPRAHINVNDGAAAREGVVPSYGAAATPLPLAAQASWVATSSTATSS